MKPIMHFVFAAATVCASAQDAKSLLNSAPPAVEKELRERVTAFYQCFVEQKFRTADQYVAEDTKDAFFAQEKHKMRDFEIVKIDWADGFQKASVVTAVGTEIRIRGNVVDAKAPLATRWKLEQGKWVYYVDSALGKATPVGVMKAGPGNSKTQVNIEQMIRDPNIILNQIKVINESVQLK